MITELIDDYKNLCRNVTELIDRRGYKVDFVRTRLKMSRVRFNNRRKNGNFSPDELKAIMKIVRFEKAEDAVFCDLVNKHRNEPTLSVNQTRKLIFG